MFNGLVKIKMIKKREYKVIEKNIGNNLIEWVIYNIFKRF
jgi:hypothetical protein